VDADLVHDGGVTGVGADIAILSTGIDLDTRIRRPTSERCDTDPETIEQWYDL